MQTNENFKIWTNILLSFSGFSGLSNFLSIDLWLFKTGRGISGDGFSGCLTSLGCVTSSGCLNSSGFLTSSGCLTSSTEG